MRMSGGCRPSFVPRRLSSVRRFSAGTSTGAHPRTSISRNAREASPLLQEQTGDSTMAHKSLFPPWRDRNREAEPVLRLQNAIAFFEDWFGRSTCGVLAPRRCGRRCAHGHAHGGAAWRQREGYRDFPRGRHFTVKGEKRSEHEETKNDSRGFVGRRMKRSYGRPLRDRTKCGPNSLRQRSHSKRPDRPMQLPERRGIRSKSTAEDCQPHEQRIGTT